MISVVFVLAAEPLAAQEAGKIEVAFSTTAIRIDREQQASESGTRLTFFPVQSFGLEIGQSMSVRRRQTRSAASDAALIVPVVAGKTARLHLGVGSEIKRYAQPQQSASISVMTFIGSRWKIDRYLGLRADVVRALHNWATPGVSVPTWQFRTALSIDPF